MPLISVDPDFVELPELRLVGPASHADFFAENPSHDFGEIWDRYLAQQEKIQNVLDSGRCFGLELYPANFPEDRRWIYMAAVEVTTLDSVQPTETIARFLPARRYARFTVQGPVTELSPSFRYIYGTWLPQSEIQLSDAFDLECYDDRFLGPMSPESQVDLLLPIGPLQK